MDSRCNRGSIIVDSSFCVPALICEFLMNVEEEGMRALVRSLLMWLLCCSMLMAQSAGTSQNSTNTKTRTTRASAHRRAASSAGPSTAEQLKELRDMLMTQQQQIQQLQNQLAAHDQQIQQAQQTASDANTKASEAAAKASEAQSTN